jgi:hypothetical protein
MQRAMTGGSPPARSIAFSPRSSALEVGGGEFTFFTAAILARVFIGANLLNGFVSYTTPGGGLLEKLHPASVVLFALVLSRLPLVVARLREQRLLVIAGAAAGLAAVVLAQILLGRGNPFISLVIVDTLVCGLAAFSYVLLLDDRRAALLRRWLVLAVILHGVLIAFEFAAGWQLVPRPQAEAVFRPSGLLNHPLDVGFAAVLAMAALLAGPAGAIAKAAGCAALLAQILLCNVRLAALVGGVLMLLAIAGLAAPPARRNGLGDLVALATLLLVLPLAVYVAADAGVFDRFAAFGVTGGGAAMRLDAFRLLPLLSEGEALAGIDYARVVMLLEATSGGRTLESTPVMYLVFLGFLLGSLVLLLIPTIVVALHWRAGWRSLPMGLAFILLNAGSIVLSTKDPVFTLYLVLMTGFLARARA